MSLVIGLLLLLFIGYFIWRKLTDKYVLVYITQDVNDYMRVSGALSDADIHFKSSTGGQEFNSRKNAAGDSLPAVSYSITVYEEKSYKAQQVINRLLLL